MNIEEMFSSAGVSIGAYGLYKIAVRLYHKYYISSECHHPTDHSTDLVIHIEGAVPEQPAEQPVEQPAERVEMARVG